MQGGFVVRHLLKKVYVRGIMRLVFVLVVASFVSSNVGMNKVQGMSLTESDWSISSVEEEGKAYVEESYNYPSEEVLSASYKVVALCLIIALGILIISFLLCAKDGNLKIYTLAGKCAVITFIWMILLSLIYGLIGDWLPDMPGFILVNSCYLLFMYREFKLLKNENSWKRTMIAGLGSGAIFVILKYCVILFIFSMFRDMLRSGIYYIVGYNQVPITNGSLIHNVEVQTAADFYNLLFEAIWLMIMITAVIVLLGTFIKQEKEWVGLASSIVVVTVLSIAIELLGGNGYPVYCLLGVAGVACIIVTYRLKDGKNDGKN